MAVITYPITAPDYVPSQITPPTLRRSQGVAQSPFSLTTQVVDFGGARWEMSVTMPVQFPAAAREWRAFFARLQGVAGTFIMPTHIVPGGTAEAVGNVNVSTTVGANFINAKWFGASATLLRGDFIEVGGLLYMLTQDTTMGANDPWSGHLHITPNLRRDVAENDTIRYRDLNVQWRLRDAFVPTTLSVGGLSSVSFDCVEAI